MKCLQFQQFVSKRIKIPDRPLSVTIAGKSDRTCTSCRIILLSAMHLFLARQSDHLPSLCQSICHKLQCHNCAHSVLFLSPPINPPIVLVRHTANIQEILNSVKVRSDEKLYGILFLSPHTEGVRALAASSAGNNCTQPARNI